MLLISKEIEPFVKSYIYSDYFENLEDFKKFLNVQLQEYARRLGLNELFQEIDNNTVEKLLAAIEENFPIKMETIRNQNKYVAKGNFNLQIKFSLFFKLRNFGAKLKLVEFTTNFLKKYLDILYSRTLEIFENNLISRYGDLSKHRKEKI
ncbi:unnamed protein product [Brachionus calyciflorus]|uniref:Uncharacterized protein n=1 Tax=Brachionus calyciflorus TaxID=104777 RepID=A0A814L137_9BILA|nr:unnamed protein product [Brachionus calyciflorus]